MKNSLSMLLAFCLLLSSCHGGNGSGSSPNPNLVTVGTVTFDTRYSTDFSRNAFSYDLTVSQNWNVAIPVGSALQAEVTPYTPGVVDLPGQRSLPCAIVASAAGTATPCIYVAVSIYGELFAVTFPSPVSNTPIVLAEPMLLVPGNTNQYAGYSYAVGISPTDTSIATFRGDSPYQLIVVSVSETSPHGFLDCLHVRLISGSSNTTVPFFYSTVDVWYQQGVGAVDNVLTPGTASPSTPAAEEYRSDVAFPG